VRGKDMVLMDIHDIFRNRKSSIQEMLKNSEGSIALEKKHEMIGAINEIDIMLRTLEYYNVHGRKDSTQQLNLLSNSDSEKGFFSRFSDALKKK
jgi:hypothetical protein